jgi:hypothetical protein
MVRSCPAKLVMTAFDFFLRLLFWSALYVAGARVGAWLVGSQLRGLSHLAWDGLVGLPLLISVWLTIGLFRFDRPTIGITCGLFFVIALLRARKDPISRFALRDAPRSSLLALGILGLVVALGLIWNRVPVLFYDSMAYHFAQPELWLLDGRIAPYEWSLHSWFPPGMSVLYGVGLALGGEAWANDANLMLGIALGLTLFDLARRLWSPQAGLVALVALLSVPQLLYALSIPAADLGHATFVSAALGALLLWHWDRDGDWARRAAWITGGALLTKYLGLLVPLTIGILFAASSLSRNVRLSKRIVLAVGFCVPGLALLLPWLIANTVTVGNPLAPIFGSWFPVEGLAGGGDLAFTRDARGGLPGLTEVTALFPGLFGSANPGIYPGPAWGWPIAVWIVAGGLGALFDRRVRLALGGALALFAIWFVTFRWERFLIPTTFFLCLAFAGTVWMTTRHARVWRLLALTALIAGWAYVPTSLTTIARFTGATDVFLGREDPQAFLHRSVPQQRLLDDTALLWNPASDRILLLGEMRHYRVPVRRVAPSGFNVHPLAVALERLTSTEQIHQALIRDGFSHVLIDFGWIERSAQAYPSLRSLRESPEKFRAYVDSLGPPLLADGQRALFRIPEVP